MNFWYILGYPVMGGWQLFVGLSFGVSIGLVVSDLMDKKTVAARDYFRGLLMACFGAIVIYIAIIVWFFVLPGAIIQVWSDHHYKKVLHPKG
ncbi:hypothetical protein A2V71_02790 [Candidatus Berkelbacteria bacterium RBG_13_40_8]|uniref:Uncharacterized protein n=1 Tax=Candidatus Berkelbacteria bacterium RBG_13_40_8 TaxID=1797467 RepID=A0A1F5DM52_9BACT|nr:MAG: hypothetical protein A2V71_02790 [Candidatus Berkelbacteria bacterium RBG_13_40_8]